MLAEFTGHKQSEYKLDSGLLSSDAQVVSGSEDGKAVIWDLVEVWNYWQFFLNLNSGLNRWNS